jgi:hypothetical protein
MTSPAEQQALLARYARAVRTLHEEQWRVQHARDAHNNARRRLADAQTEYTAARFAAGPYLAKGE